MKVKDLLLEIQACKKQYGDDFLNWDVYTEQLQEDDKETKRNGVQKGWGVVIDGDGWEYFECVGFTTKMPVERVFTINVNY